MREPSILRPMQGWARYLTLHGSIAAVAILLLALIGPLGTFTDFRLGTRLAYWSLMVLSGYVIYHYTTRIAFTLRHPTRHSWWVTLIAAELVGSLLLTAVVVVIERSFRDILRLTPAMMAEVYVYVLVVTVMTASLPMWIELQRYGVAFGILPRWMKPAFTLMPVPPASPVPAEPEAVAFLRRIPERLGQDLLALEMEDHYVRIHTAQGSDLILMRLRDAVDELAGLEGLQVHRSYWVAADAVADVERTGSGKLALVLRNGLKVPVSRTHAAAVRAAGWLERAGRRQTLSPSR